MKAGWEVKTLAETCKMYQPKTISGKEMVTEGAYPVFGANGIIGRYDQFNHAEPQLLITCRGATCGSVNVSLPNSWITGNAMVVRPMDDSIDLRYLEYYFRGGIDISQAITGAAQPQITRTNLEPLTIQYPTALDEQRRIVAVLDKAFAGIATATANAQKNLTNARALFESFLKDELAESPISSMRSKLADLCANGRIITYGVIKLGDETVKGVPCLRTSNVRGTLGGVAVASAEMAGWNVSREVAVVPVDTNRTLSEYLAYWVGRKDSQDWLTGVQKGAAYSGINIADLRELMVNVPSIKEQRAIVDRLSSAQEKCNELGRVTEQKLTALAELKQSLLQKAFAGELT